MTVLDASRQDSVEVIGALMLNASFNSFTVGGTIPTRSSWHKTITIPRFIASKLINDRGLLPLPSSSVRLQINPFGSMYALEKWPIWHLLLEVQPLKKLARRAKRQ